MNQQIQQIISYPDKLLIHMRRTGPRNVQWISFLLLSHVNTTKGQHCIIYFIGPIQINQTIKAVWQHHTVRIWMKNNDECKALQQIMANSSKEVTKYNNTGMVDMM